MGAVIVGIGDLILEQQTEDKSTSYLPIIGDAITIVAMMFWAGQVVYEENFIKKYDIKPMIALGMEGVFGVAIISVLLVIFYFIKVPFDMGQPNGVLEDAIDGFIQLGNNVDLLLSYIGATCIFLTCALSGIIITRELSSVHRMVLKTGTSFLVWIVSLAASKIFGQQFQVLQVLGFLTMVAGTIIFNDILPDSLTKLFKKSKPELESGNVEIGKVIERN